MPGNPNTFTYNNVPIQISQATILKAIAVSPGWQPSEVISGDYLFKAANPTFSIPEAGTNQAKLLLFQPLLPERLSALLLMDRYQLLKMGSSM